MTLISFYELILDYLLINILLQHTFFKDVSFKIIISLKFLKFSEIPPESAAITGNLKFIASKILNGKPSSSDGKIKISIFFKLFDIL